MKIIFSIVMFILTTSCDENVSYTKYVYQFPTAGQPPYQATSTADIWFTRVKYRGLTKLMTGGFVKYDMAKDIQTNDFKKFTITIKENLKFHSGKHISTDEVISSIKHLKENFKSPLTQNLHSIKKVDDYIFEVNLRKKNIHFKKVLSSHIFRIFNPKDLNDTNGMYIYNKNDQYFKRKNQNNEYPSKITLKKVKSINDIDFTDKHFDTALVAPGIIQHNKSTMKYKIFESWGFVLNLKDTFKHFEMRKCLATSLNREKIFSAHKSQYSVSSRLFKKDEEFKKCNQRLKFNLDIPLEIGNIGKDICDTIKEGHTVTCNFIKFTTLLDNLQKNNFDASLLALTVDLPYIESFNDYLQLNDSFQILNKKTALPKELFQKLGNEYLSTLDDFIYNNHYFIVLGKPTRIIGGSNIKKYTPSLLNPGYDSLENLNR